MTLVAAIKVGSQTALVADRARLLGGPTTPTRDDNAMKIVAHGGDFAVALVGDISFGSPRPEDQVVAWVAQLLAEPAANRPEWLRQQSVVAARRTSGVGFLLLFDADFPDSLATITISPSPSGVGVDVAVASSKVRTDEPQVWGIQSAWIAVSGEEWAPVPDAAVAAAAIQMAVASYAADHSTEVVSKATCAVLIGR